jgi:hypothetical protein
MLWPPSGHSIRGENRTEPSLNRDRQSVRPGLNSALLLGAMTYLSAACLLLNIGLIPFSPAAVYKTQLLIIPGIIAFARKIMAENREKMKPHAVVVSDGSCNH